MDRDLIGAMTRDLIGKDLNEEQARAVDLVHGPVCILAGAGTGKTTTITRRVANQVAGGAFRPEEILAVTFTDKAAGEMRSRLAALGVSGVRARTFHSAALAQISNLGEEPLGQVLASKAMAIRQIVSRLPRPYRFRPVRDIITEVEWAKNRRIDSGSYLHSLDGHEPPIPADLMAGVFRDYERGKEERGLVDFEDLLERAIRLFDDDYVQERFRARYAAFTIDEFQDVNLLQYSLLERWLGERDEICAVGDDYQSIYAFTGATPEYLLGLPQRFTGTRVVKLETNYRSTAQVLSIANRLVPKLGGARKVLEPRQRDGPEPELRPVPDERSECVMIVEGVRRLTRRGVSHDDIAILYRTNFRSEDFEDALAEARIPFQLHDSAFLSRPAARRLIATHRRSQATDVHAQIRAWAERQGYEEDPADGLGEQEMTRQKDLARLIRLAGEWDDGSATLEGFVGDIEARFGRQGDSRGVHLLTYHRAKGLEFEAVFLPRLNEGELPYRRSTSPAALAEERRLLYVGLTRAKRYVTVSWVHGARAKPSCFVAELGAVGLETTSGRSRGTVDSSSPIVDALKSWRRLRARAANVPAYVVLDDRTLREIAARMPKTKAQLASVSGIGPLRLDGYGDEILAILAESRSAPSR